VLLDHYQKYFDAPIAPAHLTGTAHPGPPMTGFHPEAKWNELKCSKQQVLEPNTAFTNLVGPTVPTGE
jgi:hypothetical protein